MKLKLLLGMFILFGTTAVFGQSECSQCQVVNLGGGKQAWSCQPGGGYSSCVVGSHGAITYCLNSGCCSCTEPNDCDAWMCPTGGGGGVCGDDCCGDAIQRLAAERFPSLKGIHMTECEPPPGGEVKRGGPIAEDSLDRKLIGPITGKAAETCANLLLGKPATDQEKVDYPWITSAKLAKEIQLRTGYPAELFEIMQHTLLEHGIGRFTTSVKVGERLFTYRLVVSRTQHIALLKIYTMKNEDGKTVGDILKTTPIEAIVFKQGEWIATTTAARGTF